MTVDVKKDGEGFPATVRGKGNRYAFADSTADALWELGNVVEMMDEQYEMRMSRERSAHG